MLKMGGKHQPERATSCRMDTAARRMDPSLPVDRQLSIAGTVVRCQSLGHHIPTNIYIYINKYMFMGFVICACVYINRSASST